MCVYISLSLYIYIYTHVYADKACKETNAAPQSQHDWEVPNCLVCLALAKEFCTLISGFMRNLRTAAFIARGRLRMTATHCFKEAPLSSLSCSPVSARKDKSTIRPASHERLACLPARINFKRSGL